MRSPARLRLRDDSVLRIHDFRLLLIGNVISQVGTWAQYVGVGWAAAELTDSSFVVAATFASQFAPALLLSPVAGVLADRFDRRHMVIAGNVAMAVPPLLIGLLITTDHLTILNLIVLVSLGGVALSLTQPASAAIVPMLVRPDQIPSAVAANTGWSNLTRVVGPGIGGYVIRTWGLDWSYFVNAISFAAVVAACSMIRTRVPPAAIPTEPFGERFRAGLRYARANRLIIEMLLVALVTGFLTMHAPLMPVIARELLDGDVSTYSQLAAAPGFGAVAGSLLCTRFVTDRARLHAVTWAVLGIGCALSVVSVSRLVPLTFVALSLYGFVFFVQFTLSSTMVINASDDEYRGRVMGLFGTLNLGMIPMGALAGGGLAALIGVPWTVGLCGAGSLAYGLRLLGTDPLSVRTRPAPATS